MPKDNDDYNPYMKVLGDLKMMMKKKMLEDKLHYSQHDKMGKSKEESPKEEYEEKESMVDNEEEVDRDSIKDYMKGRRNKKEAGASLMIAITGKGKAPKKAKSKGKSKKRA